MIKFDSSPAFWKINQRKRLFISIFNQKHKDFLIYSSPKESFKCLKVWFLSRTILSTFFIQIVGGWGRRQVKNIEGANSFLNWSKIRWFWRVGRTSSYNKWSWQAKWTPEPFASHPTKASSSNYLFFKYTSLILGLSPQRVFRDDHFDTKII